MDKNKLNEHLGPIFQEVLPVLNNSGIKYWVFGGVGVAGIVGNFIRENKDVDIYILEEDFLEAEKVLKSLVEKHGDWDGDGWKLTYSMTKKTSRPKLELLIKEVERFSVIPVYKVRDGIELRTSDVFTLTNKALEQEQKNVDGYTFYTPPNEIIVNLLKHLIEIHIKHYNKPEPPKDDSRHTLDAKAVLTKEEFDNYLEQFKERAKLVSANSSSSIAH